MAALVLRRLALIASEPLWLSDARTRVADARHREEQVAQAIEVANQRGRDRRFAGKRQHSPLGATTDGAREVEVARGERSAGQDEALQWHELVVERVDPSLELRHIVV